MAANAAKNNAQAFVKQMTNKMKNIKNDQIWIDPYTNERIWVFNPMHIVQLTKRQQSKFIRVVEGFKKFSNKWFSHVLLLLFLILYGFLGAYIFVTLEAPIETTTKTQVNNMRERIVKELWWSSRKFSKGWWVRLAKIRFKEFEKQLHEACLSSQTTDSEQKIWNFWQALFFSSTIFTTIGYGHVVPKTDAGRVASIIYAFIGIPLLLMVLTDLGKLFTRGIKFVFKIFRKIYYTRQLRKMREATKVPTQLVSQTFDAVNKKMSTVVPLGAAKSNNPHDLNTSGGTLTTDDDETIPDFEVDDEFNLPISVAVVLLLLYMMFGAAVFTIWEKWTFFESFYFVYISLSTIGFGDYVPEHPAFMMCTFIYLLFGLALTSMCINVVQEKLSATFQKAKLRIGATMGLDIPQMVEEELNQDNVMISNLNSSVDSNNPSHIPRPILREQGIGESFRARRQKRRQSIDAGKSNSSSGQTDSKQTVNFADKD
ncbi:TWiK family of potassium channels protein 18 [Sarcoptes scabiei]|uniref:TWiK family of potassium channels protein 18 n=1 Tax=Sarcoptes scabiei TaxID=52283 RepID=A0A834R4I1_SARSC|nr:TWiK family of potassium channels protein 18 [Sarcoptes scabiei]